jgi:hypothetical protein
VLLVAPAVPTPTCQAFYRPAGHRVHVPWARRALDGDETNIVSVVEHTMYAIL